jgi:hypothetical protein
MLHEILLSLSGHPSPLLRYAANPSTSPPNSATKALSPPELALLASLAHISDLHINLLHSTSQISTSSPSSIIRAVATAIDTLHLAAFRQKVLDVEESLLRKDAGLVGAYNLVPLTAVVGEFEPWRRRLEWLWSLVEIVGREGRKGSEAIDWLRGELTTGYQDVEETARSLVRVAETAWLKQVSAWILYGRLPSYGEGDFFVQRVKKGGSGEGKGGGEDAVEEEYISVHGLLPGFVSASTAGSMLFIGQSLNRIRSRSLGDPGGLHGTGHLSSQLRELSKLEYPLDSASFGATITHIRQYLSRTTLRKLLPLSRVMEVLQLLRDFFLLGRGEFAMALIQQADERIRSRWRRAENLAYETKKRDGLGTVVLKEGEVSAVLARTWAALGSMQGQHADEDPEMELARDLLRLTLGKSLTPSTSGEGTGLGAISPTPFHNLLFSVPVTMTLQVPPSVDLFLGQSDLSIYTAINAYLLSIRRAHIRLTDLWKMTSLRRHHPPPPYRAGREKTRLLRSRHIARENALRSTWATSSAAIFFLAETEGYLQTEVVAGLWDGLMNWITTGNDDQRPDQPRPKNDVFPPPSHSQDEDDIWMAAASSSSSPSKTTISNNPDDQSTTPDHDPQSLSQAHRTYLRALIHRLLLTHRSFTEALYELLVHIDRLVALVTRLQAVWTAADLEEDVGVVDAFINHEQEESRVLRDLRVVERKVRDGVEAVVAVLRALEGGRGGSVAEAGDEGGDRNAVEEDGEMEWREEGMYVPRRVGGVGGVGRLLMKLDFGSWFDVGREEDEL